MTQLCLPTTVQEPPPPKTSRSSLSKWRTRSTRRLPLPPQLRPPQLPPNPQAKLPPSQSLPIRDAKSASPAQPETLPQPQSAKEQGQDQGKAKSKNDAAAASADASAAPGDKTLSAGELKKKAKAEKAARRAKERQERESGAGAAGSSVPAGQRAPNTPKKDAAGGAAQKGSKAPYARRGSMPAAHAGGAGAVEQKQKKKEDKSVAVFGHLYGQQRRTTVSGAAKEVHPAVLALGLQMRDYVVCGSSARCVATMLAFKRITYLSTCRPLSISQGNAIRALKLSIASMDPATPESAAKATLCDFIDSFIREKITVADQVIAGSAAQKIQNGDVIVTFAGSSVVKQSLLAAHKEGKKFRVSIIDSRPLFEGKNLARALANAGLDVQYSLVHGISHAIKDATKVFLGAHAMTSNGRLYSRVGTALVAMSAKERAGGVEVPVIVCCETVKFTDRVALDSIVVNEIADADELVAANEPEQVTGLPDPAAAPPVPETNKKGGKNAAHIPKPEPAPATANPPVPLATWKDTPNLQLLNLMYDVTPAEYVDMVVTEMGSLPPSAVPIVHRMSTNIVSSAGWSTSFADPPKLELPSNCVNLHLQESPSYPKLERRATSRNLSKPSSYSNLSIQLIQTTKAHQNGNPNPNLLFLEFIHSPHSPEQRLLRNIPPHAPTASSRPLRRIHTPPHLPSTNPQTSQQTQQSASPTAIPSFLPVEDIYVQPQHQPPNPEDEDDVVPDQHAAFGITRAMERRREAVWRDLGLEALVNGEGHGGVLQHTGVGPAATGAAAGGFGACGDTAVWVGGCGGR
ncbi:translation initiation factor eIF-2B subunit delta [Penicillium chermesinum]|uniref:Translation initiation factor eIF2B subunit delta n=1 Tax=Penicillium chermesinum TaxID=63820 RepID=A0A9W9PIM4_9EURO|nr:translation initiation factor eIF-2B subunit delta [Penicillium chermesinum]KAJ5246626.1 translation initiation factor eIF-2B subunit delta [Penicillium chermesinum]